MKFLAFVGLCTCVVFVFWLFWKWVEYCEDGRIWRQNVDNKLKEINDRMYKLEFPAEIIIAGNPPVIGTPAPMGAKVAVDCTTSDVYHVDERGFWAQGPVIETPAE